MRLGLRIVGVLLGLWLAGLACAAVPDRRMAITFDDLPWASLDPTTPLPATSSVPPAIGAAHARLLATLVAAKVPAIGFVNASRLIVHGQPQADRVALLQAWLDAGLVLGNHTASHVDLHAVGLAAYEQDIVAGDAPLRALLSPRGQVPQWFRHPYLRTGRTLAEKAALEQFLADHGYRIAPVTVTSSDWIWAAAYRKALERDDAATQRKLRDAYVPYLLRTVAYFEGRSQALLGRELPQVLLLHASELNADTFDALANGLRTRGYRFVTLDEALRDPAYQRPDAYTGPLGTSWLHRWAMAEGRPWTFWNGQPTSPKWVLDLAGVPAGSE
jgi:peptidoglycan/xylan/chitin deacetylase (PgdA/CDA1 family)